VVGLDVEVLQGALLKPSGCDLALFGEVLLEILGGERSDGKHVHEISPLVTRVVRSGIPVVAGCAYGGAARSEDDVSQALDVVDVVGARVEDEVVGADALE